MKEYINGRMDEKRSKKLIGEVDYASMQSSEMERVAQEAEREVDSLKKAEYMADRVGEEFDGIISSVTNFGIFVQLANTIEGLVHISELTDDYYVYDEKYLSLVGERTKKIYKLGDEARIKVDKVSVDSHEIYFKLVENKGEAAQGEIKVEAETEVEAEEEEEEF